MSIIYKPPHDWCMCVGCRGINNRMMSWPTETQSSLERRWQWLLHNSGGQRPPTAYGFMYTGSTGPK